jgi:2-oxoglutarate/2-oxoacid ferredoxin oxidoreductase subunit beta
MTVAEVVGAMVLPARTKAMGERPIPYCPGCGHGTAQRLIADTIESLGIRERVVGVIGAGCYTNGGMGSFDFPRLSSLHGRAPAVATGLKRARPEAAVFTLQGDGDLAAIGMGEIMHACMRGERITVVMLNNSTYGNTGGQLAPTTQVGQRTATTPSGRELEQHGEPMRMAELLATLSGVKFAARGAVNTAQNLWYTKRFLRSAFEVALAGKGLGFVEILSQCPTFWGVDPTASLDWVKRSTEVLFPLGETKRDLG